MDRITSKLGFLSGMFIIFSASFACAGERGFNLSLMGGLNAMTIALKVNTPKSTSFGYGARIGYAFHPDFEVGLSAVCSPLNPLLYGVSFSQLGLQASQTFYSADIRTKVSTGSLGEGYFGINLGLAYNAIGDKNKILDAYGITVNSDSSFAMGFHFGYDFKVLSRFDFGPRIAYTFDTNGGYYSPSVANFQSYLSLRYNFY